MGSITSLAVEVLLAMLAPPRCAACDEPVHLLTVFCPACAQSAAKASPVERPALAALVYGGAVARAITRMKYESRPDLARPLGDLTWRALEPHRPSLRGAVVVPVPLHPSRLAERGFNPSALLARRVARHLCAPFAPRALARIRETKQQAILDRAARVANVAGAFEARSGGGSALVRGGVVLLVDDVATTGATLDACESALSCVGISRVYRAVVASTPQRVEGGPQDLEAPGRPWGYHGAGTRDPREGPQGRSGEGTRREIAENVGRSRPSAFELEAAAEAGQPASASLDTHIEPTAGRSGWAGPPRHAHASTRSGPDPGASAAGHQKYAPSRRDQ
jgi:ComF family protein